MALNQPHHLAGFFFCLQKNNDHSIIEPIMIAQDIIEKLRPGMQVRIQEKIKEADKSRLSSFTGTILAIKHGRGLYGTMTLRNTVAGVGVEKVIPFHSPLLEKVQIMQTPKKFKRSKLYYLRSVSRREAKRKLSSTLTE